MDLKRQNDLLTILTGAVCAGTAEVILPDQPMMAMAIGLAGTVLVGVYAVERVAVPLAALALGCYKKIALRFSHRNPDEMKATAYHEAGHAVVAWLTPGYPLPTNATIVRNDDHLGEVNFEDQEDQSKQALLADIRVSLAGPMAEEMGTGNYGSGSRGDLADASATATAMVAEYGMSEAFGPQVFPADKVPTL
ncbi:MAG: hypothetical protein AAB692_03415, partial [Patescibacteria group bacterium]